jgi:hypothetical protein
MIAFEARVISEEVSVSWLVSPVPFCRKARTAARVVRSPELGRDAPAVLQVTIRSSEEVVVGPTDPLSQKTVY